MAGTEPVAKRISRADRLRKAGDLDAARTLYKGILDSFPMNVKAKRGLAACQAPASDGGTAKTLQRLLGAGQLAEAEALGRTLIASDPNDPLIAGLYGAALGGLGRHVEAISAFRHAVKLAPKGADGHGNLGKALYDAGEPEEACAALHKAIALNPDHRMAYTNLGNALMALDKADEAIAAYERQLRIVPEQREAWMGLAVALSGAGELDKARTTGEAAMARHPKYFQGHRNLSTIKRYTQGDPHLAALEDLYPQLADGSMDRMQVAFALGKAYDDIQRVDDAYAALADGNRIYRKMSGYNPQNDRNAEAVIQRIFADGPLADVAGAAPTPRPVFILGMPRSGTTLVEQILASHPEVTAAGEVGYLHSAVWPRLQQAGRDLSYRFEVEDVRAAYLGDIAKRAPDAPVITDKTPSNFRFLGFLLSAMPEARVIHTMRDPVAVGWSIWKHHFTSKGMDYGCDFADIAAYYRGYKDLMALWHRLYPGRILNLSYEELTVDQEAQSRRIVDAAGLKWDPACLDFHKTRRVVRTASSGQVRQAIYKGSSEAWRAYAQHLSPLIDALPSEN